MSQKITHGIKEMVKKAEAEIETLPAADAVAVQGRDDTVLVDLRDPREREREGVIPGAFSCTRGMLEFWIDPESPYHKAVFTQDKRFVFFCAGGMRSALAAQTAKQMGLQPVAHIEGGFKAWREAGGPTERLQPKPAKTE
jgi:rhodanese-related sulfurtransferase